jgi:hypothetical protein
MYKRGKMYAYVLCEICGVSRHTELYFCVQQLKWIVKNIKLISKVYVLSRTEEDSNLVSCYCEWVYFKLHSTFTVHTVHILLQIAQHVYCSHSAHSTSNCTTRLLFTLCTFYFKLHRTFIVHTVHILLQIAQHIYCSHCAHSTSNCTAHLLLTLCTFPHRKLLRFKIRKRHNAAQQVFCLYKHWNLPILGFGSWQRKTITNAWSKKKIKALK